MERHPFILMLPTTMSCSFALVLPVGTPPNAIVFGSGMVKVTDMVSRSLLLIVSIVPDYFDIFNLIFLVIFNPSMKYWIFPGDRRHYDIAGMSHFDRTVHE